MNAHRLVRVIAREPHTRAASELYLAAMEGRKAWTLAEWEAVLADLDKCELTIEDWQKARADWL